VRYLSCNFQKPLSLDTVARELGVSKYHLSHIFSSRLHTSFSEYVNFLRLNLARELLLTTDQSILELGLTCGFSSQRTFNRVFQIHMGMSPRQYRELKSVASHSPLTIP
ncbi:helix-turn-helix transcriptional regulator, partial [Gemmiger formicilis]|uniref:helix-turn-helix transcriptional regulator n=2 Tax=Eubacteriales TaxID=186802 RepID=UPI001957B6DA